MPISVKPIENMMTQDLRLLVTVSEDFMFSERRFRECMVEMVHKVIEETVRATMVKFGDAMNEVLSLENLRNVVIAELQKRVTEVKPDASL